MTIIIFHEKFSLFDMKPLKIAFDLLINLRQPRALEVKYQARILHLKFSKIFVIAGQKHTVRGVPQEL